MDAISYAVDRASDRRLVDMLYRQELEDRQRDAAEADAVREIKGAGYADTDWMIDKYLRFDQQVLVSQVLWAAMQYGAADKDRGDPAEQVEALLAAAQTLCESVIAGRRDAILRQRGLM